MHVGEGSSISHYLSGGEVLLTSGGGFGGSVRVRREFLKRLAESDIAAIILELQTVYDAAPRDVIDECEALGIPLIVLDVPVAFVEVTQEVHSALVDQRVSALAHREAL